MGRGKAGQRRRGMEVARGGGKRGQDMEVLQEEADERLGLGYLKLDMVAQHLACHPSRWVGWPRWGRRDIRQDTTVGNGRATTGWGLATLSWRCTCPATPAGKRGGWVG